MFLLDSGVATLFHGKGGGKHTPDPEIACLQLLTVNPKLALP